MSHSSHTRLVVLFLAAALPQISHAWDANSEGSGVPRGGEVSLPMQSVTYISNPVLTGLGTATTMGQFPMASSPAVAQYGGAATGLIPNSMSSISNNTATMMLPGLNPKTPIGRLATQFQAALATGWQVNVQPFSGMGGMGAAPGGYQALGYGANRGSFGGFGVAGLAGPAVAAAPPAVARAAAPPIMTAAARNPWALQSENPNEMGFCMGSDCNVSAPKGPDITVGQSRWSRDLTNTRPNSIENRLGEPMTGNTIEDQVAIGEAEDRWMAEGRAAKVDVFGQDLDKQLDAITRDPSTPIPQPGGVHFGF